MSYSMLVIRPDRREGDQRDGSNYFFLPGTQRGMEWSKSEGVKTQKQKRVNPMWDLSQGHVCHRKADPGSVGAAKRLGNRERCGIERRALQLSFRAVWWWPCSRESEGEGNKLQDVYKVCLPTKISSLAQTL